MGEQLDETDWLEEDGKVCCSPLLRKMNQSPRSAHREQIAHLRFPGVRFAVKGEQCMQIVEFNRAWMEQAQGLIRSSYLDERKAVPALPERPAIPPLDALAENGLGVAAVEDGKLLGFLGAYGPWQPVFCTPDVRCMHMLCRGKTQSKSGGACIRRQRKNGRRLVRQAMQSRSMRMTGRRGKHCICMGSACAAWTCSAR